jgi:hypothetical protein
MKKNLIIGIETLLILGFGLFIYSALYQHKESKFIRFPEIKLGENEQIIGAEMMFQTAYVKSILNIPPGWYVNMDLDVPSNPVFKGSIIVGAAALGSSRELPKFAIESYSTGINPKALKAIFDITKYPPGNLEDGRRIEIVMNKP